MNSVKCIKLRLKEPTKRKKEKINKFMTISKDIANFTCNRMHSFPDYRYKTQGDNTWYRIVKDIRNDYAINAMIVNEIVQKVRTSFASWKTNNGKEKPKFKNATWIPYRKNIKFFKKDNRFYISLPFESGRGSREVFPIVNNDYFNYFVKNFIDEKINYGSGELVKHNGDYYFHISIKKEVDLDYEPKTFIGVDLGLNVIAWAVAINSEGKFLDEIHFDGGQAGWVRDRYFKKRKRLQEEGNMSMVKKIKDRESRWMENMNNKISRRIVDFASNFEKPIILLEDININDLRKRHGKENPKLHSWGAGNLRDMIEYKALEKGIKTKLINPKFTSQKCPKCNVINKNNRKGIEFKCRTCGYENHADFIGATNIANRG